MAAKPLQVVVFEVAGQRLALPAEDVQELVRAVATVPLPHAPAVVEGIINLRGNIIPVLDIRPRFRLPARPLAPSDQFVVARVAGRTLALRVDRALDLVKLNADDVEETRSVVPGAEYVTWIAKSPFDLVLIHDLRTFLSRAELTVLEDALAERQTEEAHA